MNMSCALFFAMSIFNQFKQVMLGMINGVLTCLGALSNDATREHVIRDP